MKPWGNVKGQLSLIFNSLLLPSDIINYSLLSERKVVSMDDFSNLSPAARNIAMTLSTQTWNCSELFEFTAHIIDTENFEDAKPIFELASRQCPELLCIALASMDPSWDSINKEILVKLACGFLLGQPSSSVVLPRLWVLNPNMLLFCMVEMHRRDPSCLSRLLDVAQELKILAIVMDSKPYSFTLDLACLASRRQNLNIEKWLTDALKDKGEPFLRCAVEFFSNKVAVQLDRQRSGSGVQGIPVPVEILVVFAKLLQAVHPSMVLEIAEQFREGHRILASETGIPGMPQPLEQGFGIEAGAVSGLPEMTFTPDIEEEVNSFFDRMFARDIGVPEIIEVLRRLKSSSNARDQQVFACFLHNIFDEYRFFAKYPDNELNITATLFGQLVNCQLVAFMPLGLALRCVLEAMKRPASQKLFRFGVQALLQFINRLPEWPQFCAHLGQIAHLEQVYPELYTYIRSCVAGNPIAPPSVAPTSSSPSGVVASPQHTPDLFSDSIPSMASVNNATDSGNPLLDMASKQPYPSPSENVRDRILFIMNNLSATNLEGKANDLVKILEEAYFAWLAQYLVVRRASIEPNYHGLYLNFLDILQIRTLHHQVLTQTYGNIYLLLRSPKITSSSSERSLLKNLGMWLGGLTLARNQPILYQDLSLKDLLIEAFVSDRLIAIVPFVCKVIEQCANSTAFQPENPWLMAILRLLAELYGYSNIKLNLKFEVEVLCKNLQIDLHSLEPSSILKQKAASFALPYADHKANSKEGAPSGGHAFPTWADNPMAHLVVFNPRTSMLKSNSTLKGIVGLAVEYAIRDLAISVAQRSFTIASSTTRALVSKDFASEADGNQYRRAASSMAPVLAANLAFVTARDSLKSSITNNLRVFSQWAGMGHFLTDTVVDGISEDNMELASAYVEKITLDIATSQVEASLSMDLPSRKVALDLPKITPDQLRVYADFSRKFRPSHLTTLPEISLESVTQEELEHLSHTLSETAGTHAEIIDKADGPMSPGLPVAESGLDAYFEAVCLKFIDLVAAVEKAVPEAAAESVSQLPASSEIRSLMKQIVLLASSSPIHRDELCLMMSQRLMQALYKTESVLYVDIIILVLIKIFEFSSKAAKEVTTWVVHSSDERKYSVLATTALFGSGLIYVLDFDGHLAKQIEEGKERSIMFAVDLIRKCVFESPPVAAPYDFVYSLEVLGKISREEGTPASVAYLLQDIANMIKAPQPESQLLRDQITFCFTDWFRLCQYPSISEKLISSFVGQLFQRRFLQNEASARPFFQICTEISIELYVRQRRAPAILAYRSIDAYARLVGQIIKFHAESECEIDHMRIITIVHSVAAMILVQGLEQGLDYLQRPFSRLFVSLNAEILANEDRIEAWPVVENLSAFYMVITPAIYPSFAFGWFELVINRQFLPRLLMTSERRGFPILYQLLSEYVRFASPILQDHDANSATRALYRGILRSFLVILHDCPDFFVQYGRKLSVLLPASAVQLRNTVLAAVPASLLATLPDPLSAVVRTIASKDRDFLDRLQEAASGLGATVKMAADDAIHQSNASGIQASSNGRLAACFRSLIGQCKTGASDTLAGTALARSENGWNVELLGSLVGYFGLSSMASLPEGGDIAAHVKNNSCLTHFARILCQESDNHGRYYLFSAIADHLMYPSGATSYFYCQMLWLFVDAGNEFIREVATRVLLERLIVHRPHPWGIMVTFIELVKNSKYNFWNHAFTRATPDIERVFDAISRSCLGISPPPPAIST